jgi:predicted lipoprotein with Yx(FWY)xxD motif
VHQVGGLQIIFQKGSTVITNMKSAAFRSRARRRAALLPVAVLALAMAGCSGSSNASSGPVPSATGDLVSAQKTSLGTVLVNGKGRTVYEFANDKAGVSTCTGACSANWPLVAAPASIPSSLPGVTGAIGATPSGARQLTIAKHPVYTFVGDTKPGQTNGQNVTLNGGLWTAVSPAGAPVRTKGGASSGVGY